MSSGCVFSGCPFIHLRVPSCLRCFRAADIIGTSFAEALRDVVVWSSLLSFLTADSQSECIVVFTLVCWNMESAVRIARISMLNAPVDSSEIPLFICSAMMGRSIQLSALLMITKPAVPLKVGEFCMIWEKIGFVGVHDPSVNTSKLPRSGSVSVRSLGVQEVVGNE